MVLGQYYTRIRSRSKVFPPPSSRSTNCVTLVPKPGRKEGHAVKEPSLLRGIAVLRICSQQEVAETASGYLRRWCWSNRRTGGMEGSLPCSWVEEGWLPSEREQRSRRRRMLLSTMSGEEQGTGDSSVAFWWLPSTGGAIAVSQEVEEHRAVQQRCPVPLHGTASESLSAG